MSIKPLLCALLAAMSAAFGTSAIAATPAAPASTATTKAAPVPLMWKVSDADNDLYLLGSFHMLKPDDYPLAKDVDLAFEDAEALAFELSPEEMNSPKLPMAMAQAGLRTDGTPLDSQLSPALAAKLRAWSEANTQQLETMSIKPAMLQMFEPWFVELMVTMVEMKKYGLDTELGLDKHFSTRAEKAGKPATGLELGSEQIAVFDTMGAAEQLAYLEDALDDAETAQTEIEALHALWRQGDGDTLYDKMAADLRKEYPKLYQRINVARNDAWLPKLQAMLDTEREKDTLVVVGALHLLGKDGVVEKLRAKGYRVQRICSSCGPAANHGETRKKRGKPR